MRTLKRICVYCGSSSGARPVYAQAARELGLMLAELGIGVVFGGGRVGLMGVLADAALEAGGEVIGVIPRSLQEKELGHGSVTELHVVETMHQRKEKMADLSDGFITLPGGIGTLEELFETFTWLQLGFHEKPVALLNVDGFYQGLTTFVRHLSEQQFLKPEHEACLIVEDSPHALLERMENFTPPDLGKWFLPSLGTDVR